MKQIHKILTKHRIIKILFGCRKESEEIESERNHEEKHGFLNFYGSLLKMSQPLNLRRIKESTKCINKKENKSTGTGKFQYKLYSIFKFVCNSFNGEHWVDEVDQIAWELHPCSSPPDPRNIQ